MDNLSGVLKRFRVFVFVFCMGIFFSSSAYAAANIVLDKRVGWNVFGLKHNNVNDGPNVTTVGWRYCNTDAVEAALNVKAEFIWDSANAYIDIRSNSLTAITIDKINPLSCYDFYFNIEVQRDTAAYDASRNYHISVTADNIVGAVISPMGEEIYVEHLVSQARNGIDSLTGPTTVVKGETYDYYMTAHTATGYDQLITIVDFANNIFQIVSVDVNYSLPTGAVNDTIYADACGWVHDPSDPDYFTNSGNIDTCKNLGLYEIVEGTDDTVGNDISAHLKIKIVGTGTAEVSGLMYDVSGSSFHYNSDYGDPLETLAITAVEPEANIITTKTVDIVTPDEGESVTFLITLRNEGPTDATNISLIDKMPLGISLTGSLPSQGTYDSGTGIWNVGGIINGSSATLALTGVVAVGSKGNTITNITTAAMGDQNDPTIVGDDLNAAITVNNPSMSIVKTADDTTDVIAGQTIIYTYVVTNTGNVVIDSVSVTDVHSGLGTTPVVGNEVITNTSGFSSDTVQNGNVDRLATGDVATFTSIYVVTQADIDARVAITNIATAEGTPTGGILTPPTDNETVNPKVGTPGLSIVKSDATDFNGGSIVLGDVLGYTVTATNTGSVTLHNVIVGDALTIPDSISCATVVPGASCVLDGNYTVVQGDIDTGSIQNTGTADSDETAPIDDNVTTPLTGTPGLSIVKSDATDFNGGSIVLGDVLGYTVTATNTGSVTLHNVIVGDALTIPDSISCATVVPGASCVLDGNYTVVQGDIDTGSIQNTGTADSDETAPIDDNVTTPLTGTPGLSIVKSDATDFNGGSIVLGDVLGYTVTATNTGSVTLHNVIVGDALTIPDSISCATVVPGASCVLDGNYTVVQGDIDTGSIQNTGTADSDETAPIDDNVTTPLTGTPGLSIVKSDATDFNGGSIVLGDVLGYTVTATNTGSVTLHNVIVGDALTIPDSISCATVVPGASCVLDGNYTVVQGDIDTGSIQNTGTADSDETAPIDDNVTTPLTGTPGLSIVKSDATDFNGGSIVLGDVLGYTVTATNTGSVTLHNVIVGDALTIPDSISCATVVPGASCVLDGNYTVVQGDIDTGSIQNTGTADSDETAPIDDNVTTPLTGTPGLSIVKSDATDFNGGSIVLGDVLGYTVTATNTGSVTLHNVIVGDALTIPDSISCATVVPGASCVLDGNYTVVQGDIDTGSIQNTGTADSDETAPIDDNVTTPLTGTPGLSIVKSDATDFNGGSIVLGDVLGYTVTATNTGSVTLHNVIVGDALTIPDSISCATVVPGASCVLDGNYTVVQGDIDTGSIQNTGTADSDETAPIDDNVTTPLTGTPGLSIVKSDATDFNGGSIVLGDVLGYTVTATNTGSVTLHNVIVGDALTIPDSISCATVVPGASCVLDGNYTVVQGDIDTGSIQNTGTADSDETAPIDDNVTTPLTGTPGLSIVKSDATDFNGGSIVLGDVLGYTVTATNTGSVTLHNVIVGDALTIPDSISCATVVPGASCVLDGNYTVVQGDIDTGSIQNTGTADSDETAPIDDNVTTPLTGTPGLSIVKSDATDFNGGSIVLGDVLGYTVTATNTGSVTLHNVIVGDALTIPDSISCATVVPGASCVLDGNYTVVQGDIDTGSIQNTGTADSDETAPIDDNVTTPLTGTPGLSIVKSDATDFNGGSIVLGDVLGYTVTATNTGSVTLHNVIVGDALTIPDSISCATVVPGASCVLDGNYTVVQGDIDTGSIQNTGTADSDETAPIDDNVTTPLTGTPGLSIVKSDATDFNGGSIVLGDVLGYTVTATNTGSVTLHNVIVGDALTIPDSISCATVVPGASCVLDGNYTVVQGDIDTGSIQNTGTADSDETAPIDDNVTTPLTGTPGLSIVKSDATDFNGGSIVLGDVLGYTVTATNTGSVTLHNVIVGDALTIPDSISCATVVPGASCVLDGNYTVVQGDIDTGSIQNTGTADSDETAPIDDNVTTPLTGTPGLSIVKSDATDFNGGSIVLGDVLGYTVTATNTGSVTLHNVIVGDALTIPDSISCATVVPGASCVLDGNYTVVQGDIDTGSIQNTGTADSDETAPIDDNVTTPLTGTPGLSIVKSDATDFNGGSIVLGDVLGYTVTATNTGSVTLHNVIVGDALTIPDSISCATVVPGASCVLDGNYTVVQGDIDTGSIQNTGTADSDETAPIDDNVTTPLTGTPGLSIVKSDATDFNGGSIVLGDVLGYTVTATNTGSVTLHNVIVGDALTIPDSISCATVVPGASCVLDGNYTVVQGDIDTGSIQNTGTADSDETAPIDDNVTTPLTGTPGLSIVKSDATDFNGGSIVLGDVLGYTVTATNTGSVTLHNVIVGDALTIPDSISCATVVPGASCVLDGNYTVVQGDIDTGSIQNTGTADSDETAPIDDNVTTPLTGTPGLSIVKSDATDFNGGSIVLGDVLGYTVTATNTGSVTLHNVIVGDALTIPDSISCATVVPGASCVLDGNYTVVQGDIDTGSIQNTGTADSDETAPIDDNVTTPLTGTPGLSIVKSDATDFNGGSIVLGDVLGYTVTATNTGSVTLHNVIVGDALTIPDSISCATVVPGASCVLDGNYTVVQGDIDTGSIQNTGTADSDETAPIDDNVTTPLTGTPGLSIVKSDATDFNGGSIVLGDVLGYTVTATNTGSVTLHNVIVGDALTIPDSISCATVVPGASCVLDGNYTVVQGDIDTGSIQNTGTADSDETAPIDDNVTTPLTGTPGLSIVKSDATDFNGGSIVLGDVLGYTVTATNTGSVTLHNVIVGDALTIPDSISCATVVPGASCVLDGNYTVVQGDIDTGSIQNTGTADSDETAPIDDNVTTPLTGTPGLSIVKSDATDFNGGSIVLGDVLGYTVTATNTGSVTLHNVIVGDALTIPDSISCATVVPGASCVLDGNYTVVQGDIDTGSIQNTGTADSDETAPIDDNVTTPLEQKISISVEKTGTFMDEDNDGYANVGETVSYEFNVSNIGSVTLYDVNITDDNALMTGGPIVSMLARQSDTVTFTGVHTITWQDILDGKVINQAIASGKDLQGNDINDISDDPQNPINYDENNDSEPDDETLTGLPIKSPTSTNDIGSGIVGVNVTIDIMNNDSGGTFDLDATTVTLLGPTGVTDAINDHEGDIIGFTVPGEGTWSVDESTGEVTFSPEDGYVGDPTPIEYMIEDTQGNPTNAEITINYPPVAIDDVNNTALPGETVSLDILSNDKHTSTALDPTSVNLFMSLNQNVSAVVDILNVETVTNSKNNVIGLSIGGEGTWSVNEETGLITFVPDINLEGNPTPIFYTVREMDGDLSNSAKIDIQIQYPISSGPIATDNLDVPITEYGPNVIDVLFNGDEWGINGPGNVEIIFTQPTYGSVALDDGGTPDNPTDDVLIYTPASDLNNLVDTFTYTITDADGMTDTATVTLNVNCASTQTSDGGDSLGLTGMLLMMFITGLTGLYFVRREEERGEA